MTVPLKEISPIVAFVASFAVSKDVSSPYAFLWFSNGKVRASSGTSGAVWQTPGVDGEFAIRADGFAALIASLATERSEAEFTVTDTRLVVKAGAFRAQFPTWPADVESPREWLERDTPVDGVDIDESYWSAVSLVRPVASVDQGKPNICGVYWGGDGTLAATDNLRASFYNTRRAPTEGVLIPSSFLAAIGSSPAFTKAFVNDRELWYSTAAGAVYSSLYEAKFPKKQLLEVVAASRTATAAVTVAVKGQVSSVLDRLLFFASKPPYKVEVEANVDSVRLWVPEEDGGGKSAEEVLDRLPVDASPCAFSVDGKNLREAFAVSTSFRYSSGRSLYFASADGKFEHVLSTLVGA